MSIWAIADLHLPFSIPEKTMEIFGENWKGYTKKIQTNWEKNIKDEDLILIPGDISWATKSYDAQKDLLWIDNLPGTKLLIKGNHDFWWTSLKKVISILPPSIHLLQNNSFLWNGIAIGGTRLWESPEYCFDNYILPNNLLLSEKKELPKEKIFQRELLRLRISLSSMAKNAKSRIAMTHFPPIGAALHPSLTSKILEEFSINTCIFGHLHNLDRTKKMFGKRNNCNYILVSADYIDFNPIQIC